jgi:hypothetical protein
MRDGTIKAPFRDVIEFEPAPLMTIPPSELQAISETAALMQAITSAASNPAVDIDKLERLLAMHERVTARQAKAAYAKALASMQTELPEIEEHGKIDIGRGKPQKYALWEDVNAAIKPILVKHGFSLSFRTGRDADKIIVTGVLLHRDGHSEETTMLLPIDASGSKNAVQAIGSSTSYGKRYTACALLNITSRGEDDDGRSSTRRESITDEQVGEIVSLMDSVGAKKSVFLEVMKVPSIPEIPANRFDEAIGLLNQVAAKRREKAHGND